MEALCGGEIYIHHARVVDNNIRTYGVKICLRSTRDKLEEIREWLREYYNADRILLAYDYVDGGR